MTKDTIFLTISQLFPRNYRIFEYVEENETPKWNYLAMFAAENVMVFPQVIKPIDNGKFIFFPTETEFYRQMRPVDALEVWEKNKTLTRSPLELTINFRKNLTQSLFILQM